MRKLLYVLSGVAIVAACLFYYEYLAWIEYERANIGDQNINAFVLYDRPVLRAKNATINFTYLTKDGVFVSAHPRLNNLGYFSERDYNPAGDDDKFRIVVIGGEQTASSTVTKSWPDFLQDRLGDGFRVYNIGWPDAGPEHYIDYWKEQGTKFRPQLVIVNFLESDFYRGRFGSSSYLRYKGKEIKGYGIARYELPKGRADLFVPYVDGAKLGELDAVRNIPLLSLRDPYVIPSRPYGATVSTEAITDPESLKVLHDSVVDDMIAGALKLYPCLRCEFGDELPPAVSVLRNFESFQVGTPAGKEQLVQFGKSTFGWMARNIQNVIFTHSYSYTTAPYEISDAVAKADPAFEYVDMRKYAPTDDESVTRTWRHFPYLGEKWSMAGMDAYAGMVERLLKERSLIP